MKPYTDKSLLYELYVKRRMTMIDIEEYFNKQGVKVTGQTIYNYLKKYDLLKYRGKGHRKLNKFTPKLSANALAVKKQRADQKARMKRGRK